jgi:hypothetical protein
MSIVLSCLAVAFAAFCIWLTVRIVNRRERRAKWTLAVVVGVPALYVASFGPACWLVSTCEGKGSEHYFRQFYRPIGASMKESEFVARLFRSYGQLSMRRGSSVLVYVDVGPGNRIERAITFLGPSDPDQF